MSYEKLIAYAQDFTSFLIYNLKTELFSSIQKIILFGSAARKEATNESDIDIFIEAEDSEKDIDAAVDRIIDRFFDSPKFKKYWKLLDIDNPISCKVGSLSAWKELYPSLIQDGIILYGKYKPCDVEGMPLLLFSWENVKPESKRVMLNRKLFGYVKAGKTYPGLVKRYDAKRIAKGALLVPMGHRKLFEGVFHSLDVPLKVHSLMEV
jgi:predicted nucleotidyltransferase